MPSYREYPPGELLAPYVTCFWELESQGEPHRVLPDAAMDVLYAMGSSGARVVGTMTRAIAVGAGEAMSVVGARLRPGAAPALTGVAARELRDDTAATADVWKVEGRAFDARLAEAPTRAGALAVLAAELERRAQRAALPDPRLAAAVRVLEAAAGELPVPAVAVRVGLGERQLHRLFSERVGYGPKMFARVTRLQRAAAALARGAVGTAAFAFAHGYTDQAHLIHEFQALAGVTPAGFARQPPLSEIYNRGDAGRSMVRP
jgi:methylphosphotriester-DNA--protein-cysteine methyltransferase